MAKTAVQQPPPKKAAKAKKRNRGPRRIRRGDPISAMVARQKNAIDVADGEHYMRFILNGDSAEEVAKKAGVEKWRIADRVAQVRALSPAAFQQLVDNARSTLARLALDDLIVWRSRAHREREKEIIGPGGVSSIVVDHEFQKVALAGYKDAKDTLIKILGLSTQKVEVTNPTNRPALTAQELAALSNDPDVREAIEAVVVAVHNEAK